MTLAYCDLPGALKPLVGAAAPQQRLPPTINQAGRERRRSLRAAAELRAARYTSARPSSLPMKNRTSCFHCKPNRRNPVAFISFPPLTATLDSKSIIANSETANSTFATGGPHVRPETDRLYGYADVGIYFGFWSR